MSQSYSQDLLALWGPLNCMGPSGLLYLEELWASVFFAGTLEYVVTENPSGVGAFLSP